MRSRRRLLFTGGLGIVVLAVVVWFAPGLTARETDPNRTCDKAIEQSEPLPADSMMEVAPAIEIDLWDQSVTCTWKDNTGSPTIKRSFSLHRTSSDVGLVILALAGIGVSLASFRIPARR